MKSLALTKNLKKITVTILVASLSLAASANAEITICESDGTGTPAYLEFQPFRPGQMEALVMEYQGQNELIDPLSVFSHMGTILFRGNNGIEFNAFEYSDEFYVTVPAFGGQPVVTARGKCRLIAQSTKVEGADAIRIFNLIQGSGYHRGTLRIVGYVTERVDPPILFDEAYLDVGANKTIRLTAKHDDLQIVVTILEKAGVEAKVISGGTTYIEYQVKISCSSTEICYIQ